MKLYARISVLVVFLISLVAAFSVFAAPVLDGYTAEQTCTNVANFQKQGAIAFWRGVAFDVRYVHESDILGIIEDVEHGTTQQIYVMSPPGRDYTPIERAFIEKALRAGYEWATTKVGGPMPDEVETMSMWFNGCMAS